MRRCSALTAGGGRCQRIVSDGGEYCYSHDPAMAEARSRNAARAGRSGGKGRPAPRAGEARAIRAELRRLAADVEGGRLDRGAAAVIAQLYNVALRALAVELKAEEHEELIPRVEAIEERLKQGGTRQWG